MAATRKTKQSTRKARKTAHKSSMGDVDVRHPSHVKGLEKLLKSTKIVVILVYADWCGHCHTYKDDVWKRLTALPRSQRKTGLAAIQAEQLKHTPFANAKLKGFPSVLVVGEDGRPADFEDENGDPTNAVPDARNKEMMEKMVTSDPSGLSPALGPNGRKEPFSPGDAVDVEESKPALENPNRTKFSSVIKANEEDTVLPPDPSKDMNIDEQLSKSLVKNPVAVGGSLFASLKKALAAAAGGTRKGLAFASRKKTRRGRKQSRR